MPVGWRPFQRRQISRVTSSSKGASSGTRQRSNFVGQKLRRPWSLAPMPITRSAIVVNVIDDCRLGVVALAVTRLSRYAQRDEPTLPANENERVRAHVTCSGET